MFFHYVPSPPFFLLCSVMLQANEEVTSLMCRANSFPDQECRQLEFAPQHAFAGKRLLYHVIGIDNVTDEESCGTLCFMEPNCVSYNIELSTSPNKGHQCELNNVTHEDHVNDLEENPDFLYRGTKSACLRNPCPNKATCQTGFTDKGYRCICASGFTGEYCELDINECALEARKCSADAVCKNNKGSYTCMCKKGFEGDGRYCQDIDECLTETHECKAHEICNNTKGSHNCTRLPCETLIQRNMSEAIVLGHQQILLACFVIDDTGLGECGNGTWTLVMKINGRNQTFRYDSPLWNNSKTYNLEGGKTGFDTQETKLPTYWNKSFSKICLGMKVDQQLNFIVINMQASSLYSLIADGQYRVTSRGRDGWKKLLGSKGSLQLNCNKEGFNLKAHLGSKRQSQKARIGIFGNNENDCNVPDSRIGFGITGYPDFNNTCGNQAKHGGDNGDTNFKAVGYILVQ